MKSFNQLLTEINTILGNKSINDLSEIDKDMIKQKLRELYDMLSFNSETAQPVQNATEDHVEIKPSDVEEKIQFLETDTEEIRNEEILSAKPEEQAEKKDKIDGSSSPDLFSSADETGKKTDDSIADVISNEKNDETIVDKIKKSSRIESLKVAIGINEKFFFINELFDGNLNDYNATIEKLESFNELEPAITYLDNLSLEKKWNKKGEAYIQLKDFVSRKLK